MSQVSCALTSKTSGPGIACLENDCSNVTLEAGQMQDAMFAIPSLAPGVHTLKATCRRGFDFAQDIVVIAIPEKPSLLIENISMPPALEYGQQGSISFVVKTNSSTLPAQADVRVSTDHFSHAWSVKDLSAPQRFTLNLQGSSLGAGENAVRILVIFKDDEGNPSTIQEQGAITLTHVTFLQQLELWARDADSWVRAKTGLTN